jgi:RNA polymerase sigma-70 factor (ECF subfamily)
MTDIDVIHAMQRGDQDALITLHQRYLDLVFGVCYRILNDRQVAEETAQDAFLRAWQHCAQFDTDRGTVISWIIGIARNLAIDRQRQQGRRTRYIDDRRALDELESIRGAFAQEDPRYHEQLNNLRLAMQTLPAEQYQVLYLSYYGGMSHQDIADHLQIPLGTIKTRMRLGLAKLRLAWDGLADDEA